MSLQRRARAVAVPPIVHQVLRSPGQPLGAATRAFMEPRFGHDFSKVRVHAYESAAESARAANAFAYAVGNDVVFGAAQYAPSTGPGRRLLAHELVHVTQQRRTNAGDCTSLSISTDRAAEHEAELASARLAEAGRESAHDHQQPIDGAPSSVALNESGEHEREADRSADAIRLSLPSVRLRQPLSVARQKSDADQVPPVERGFEVLPRLIPMGAPAVREQEKCEQFPGGSTDCEVDKVSGTPTGKVTHTVDEKNPCTKPCVEEHEAVHVKQLKTFCPKLRDCYVAADKGKRPASDCVKMVIFENGQRECSAYQVSVPCMEKRLKSAKGCQSKENKEYGSRKLASEKCFRNQYCGGVK
jgi:hypothetical protein